MNDIVTIVFAVALVGHGAAHGVAALNLVRQIGGTVKDEALEVRSWLLPGMSPATAATVALTLWLPASLGFILAAVSMLGIVLAALPWSATMVAAALLSTAGIGLFGGIWPGGERRLRALHILLALGMDAIILVTQLLLGWPPAR